MGLSRLFMRADSKQNTVTMTMGSSGYQYGYSRYYANYGEIEGEMTHDGKAVTLVMLCYYSGYLDFAFNIDGITSGSYNVTVNVTELDTGRRVQSLSMHHTQAMSPDFMLAPIRCRLTYQGSLWLPMSVKNTLLS